MSTQAITELIWTIVVSLGFLASLVWSSIRLVNWRKLRQSSNEAIRVFAWASLLKALILAGVFANDIVLAALALSRPQPLGTLGAAMLIAEKVGLLGLLAVLIWVWRKLRILSDAGDRGITGESTETIEAEGLVREEGGGTRRRIRITDRRSSTTTTTSSERTQRTPVVESPPYTGI